MLENRDFIRETCGDLRKDLDILFRTFTFTYDNITKEEQEIWNGAVVHVINEIPREEYDVKYEPRYIGCICRVRSKEEGRQIRKVYTDYLIVTHEYIYVYKLAHWRLLVWKVWDYHSSKPFDIRTFYLKDYEIYIHGGEPTEDELWYGWTGNPSYYYNFDLAIDESFTIMEWKEAQEFVNKLTKEYDWFWYIK